MQKRFSGTQIMAKLRKADVLVDQGKTAPELCKELEISQQTCCRWRQKYGGMSPDMIEQHRALRKENTRLQEVSADQALDMARSFRGEDVVERLHHLFAVRDCLGYIRSDNGPEFVSEAAQKWPKKPGVKTSYIAPDSPWENGYVESFNSRLRDELPD